MPEPFPSQWSKLDAQIESTTQRVFEIITKIENQYTQDVPGDVYTKIARQLVAFESSAESSMVIEIIAIIKEVFESLARTEWYRIPGSFDDVLGFAIVNPRCGADIKKVLTQLLNQRIGQRSKEQG